MLSTLTEPCKSAVKATKSITFSYSANEELSSLFEEFRLMCNDAIRIAVKEKPRTRLKLIELAYERLKGYGLHTHYLLSVCEVAFSVFKNKRRKSIPYVRKPFIKLDNQTYRLNHLLLRIPLSPGHFTFLTLIGSKHHMSYIDDPALKRGSVIITPRSVVITFSKEVVFFAPTGSIGMDINEKNVTVSASDGWSHRFEEFAEIVDIKERYRCLRATVSQLTRGDRRTAKGLLQKFGEREKDRTQSRIHRVTKEIVDHARTHKFDIKMENLKDIRKLYRKGNGQRTSLRGRMNTWVFGEIQRQIDYKAKWVGVPHWCVNPRGTSSYCLCGSHVVRLADRKVYCPKCDDTWDRDELASKNIMACAVPQVRPPRGSGDGEPRTPEDSGNPLSRWREG